MAYLLHISDLHIVANPQWNNMKKTILNSVREKLRNVPLDERLLVITGDCHNFNENHYDRAKEFLLELFSVMEIQADKDVFIVPGNHDVSESSDFDREIYIEAIKHNPNKLQDRMDKFLSCYDSYIDFVNSIGIYTKGCDNPKEYDRLLPVRVHVRTWRNKLHILHLNTTLIADGQTKTGQMVDTLTATSDAIYKELRSDSLPCIAIGHNNFFDLSEIQQEELSTAFSQDNISAYLCGDRHQLNSKKGENNIAFSNRITSARIPNIGCCRTSTDGRDTYSDFGMIWQKWDEAKDRVDLEFMKWNPKEQGKLQSDRDDDFYYFRKDLSSTDENSQSVDVSQQVISNSEEVEVVIAASRPESEGNIESICAFIQNLEKIYRKNNNNLSIKVTVGTNPEKVKFDNCKLFCILIDATVEKSMSILYDMAVEQNKHSGFPAIQAFIKETPTVRTRPHKSIKKFEEDFFDNAGYAPHYFKDIEKIKLYIWSELENFVPNKAKPDVGKNSSKITLNGEALFDLKDISGVESISIIEREQDKMVQLMNEYNMYDAEYQQKPSAEVKVKLLDTRSHLEEQQSKFNRLKNDILKNIVLVCEKQQIRNDLDMRESMALECITKDEDYLEANRLLRDPDWEEEIQALTGVMRDAKKRCRQYISGQKLLISNLSATGIDSKVKKEIDSIYVKIVALAEEHRIDLSVLYDYAEFLYSQKEFPEGIEVAERLVRYNKASEVPVYEDEGSLYTLLGQLCYANSKYIEALEYYRRAFDFCTKNPIANEDAMYTIHNGIATLYWKQKHYIDSKKELDKCLLPLEQLAAKKGGKFSYILAESYNRLATLASKMWLLDDAEDYHFKSLEWKRKIFSPTNIDYDLLNKIASTYNNLGIVYRKMRKYEKSEKCYIKACDIRSMGYEKRKKTFERSLAIVKSNYAYLLGEIGEIERAEQMVKEAIAIKRRLVDDNPTANLPTLAYSLDDYGVILSHVKVQGRTEEIKALFEEAIQKKKMLSLKEDHTYIPSLAESYYHYARFLSKTDKKLAAEYYEKAFDIQEEFEQDNAGYYTYELASTCYDWAMLLKDEMSAKTESLFNTAEKYAGDLMAKCPEYYKEQYVRILEDYLQFLSASGGADSKMKTVSEKIGKYK